ncbi:MAG TPA: hypothetical protein PKK50_01580 [Myxococcota bacterium]|nr:hypothetical protein [Myxococcota bacterium]
MKPVRYRHGLRTATRQRANEARGYVLLLVLLLMLGLTAIGAIAIRTTANDMAFAGAHKVSSMAKNVTSSGAEATMVFGAMNPRGFIDYVTVNNGTVAMADFTPVFFDTASDGTGSFGREVGNMNNVFWRSRMTNAQTSARAPGYQVGEHCFIRYTSYTDGVYGNQPNLADPQDVTRNAERNAMARDLATLYVGPVACP